MDECQKVRGFAIETCCDAAEPLELGEAALNAIASTVTCAAVKPWLLAAGS